VRGSGGTGRRGKRDGDDSTPPSTPPHRGGSSRASSGNRSHRSARQDKLDLALLSIARVLEAQGHKAESPGRTAPQDKFRMNNGLVLKKISMAKGQLISPGYIVDSMNQARDISMQAMKAASRMPQSQGEWDMFLKFHLSHMEGELHREMSLLVMSHSFTEEQTFWQATFRFMFPSFPAGSAISKALLGYMIWDEPRGMGRWKEITQDLVGYQADLNGKEGADRNMALSEGMYLQITRVISECPESHSAQLKRDFMAYNAPIRMARQARAVIPAAQYLATFEGFYGYLYEWLQEHSYQATFGRPQATLQSGSAPPQSGGGAPQLRAIQTEAQGKGDRAPANSRPTTPVAPSVAQSQTPRSGYQQQRGGQQKGEGPKLAPMAPTGVVRTWTWGQYCWPAKGEKTPCNNPPPPECDNPQCQYLGDWLDWKGWCTYCGKDGHIKIHCPGYIKNLGQWAKKDQQGNSQPPAK
jgi:hypothetical protein